MRRLTLTVIVALHTNRSRAALVRCAEVPQLDQARLALIERSRKLVQRSVRRSPPTTYSPLEGNAALTLCTADPVGHVVLLASVDLQIIVERKEDRLIVEGFMINREDLVIVNLSPVTAESDQTVGGWVSCGATLRIYADLEWQSHCKLPVIVVFSG